MKIDLKKTKSLGLLLSRLWVHVSHRRRKQLSGLVLLMLLGTVAEVVSLGMVLPFLGALTAPDEIFKHPWIQPIVRVLNLTSPDQLLLPLSLLFGFAAVFAGITRLSLLWLQARLGHAIGNDLGSEAYKRTLYQPYAVHVAKNSSEVVSILLTKIDTVVGSFIIPFLRLFTSTVIVIIVIAFMFFVAPEVTAMMFISIGTIYAVIAYITKKRIARNSQYVAIGRSKVAQVVQEGLGGIRDVLIDGLQGTYSQIYRRTDRQLRRGLSNITIMAEAPRPMIEAFGMVLICLVAYVLTQRQEGMATVLPVLGTLALAAQRLLPLVQQGYNAWANVLGAQASLNDVLLLLEQTQPDYIKQTSVLPLPFKQQISLQGLNFSYSAKGSTVLHNIDLVIPRGSRVGFIGTTGGGKSTLLDIIMGLLFPTSGAICIDNIVLDEINQRAWQSHIAHVPQAIFLTDASIAENIAFGIQKENIDWERMKKASKQAQVASIIESWPEDYNTLVGERGIRLSGGQRQRIGIARALYKNADVLVFDEATSALDNDTEQAVMEALDSMDKELTILMVAHRVTTLKSCDQIVELKDGKIKRIGNYQEMIGLKLQQSVS